MSATPPTIPAPKTAQRTSVIQPVSASVMEQHALKVVSPIPTSALSATSKAASKAAPNSAPAVGAGKDPVLSNETTASQSATSDDKGSPPGFLEISSKFTKNLEKSSKNCKKSANFDVGAVQRLVNLVGFEKC